MNESNNQNGSGQPKPSPRNWPDLGRQYRTIGIAAVAAAVKILKSDPKPAPRKTAVRYLGNEPA